MATEVTFDAAPRFVADPTVQYSGKDLRRMYTTDSFTAPGVNKAQDCNVTFVSSLTVKCKAGGGFIRGQFATDEGYFEFNGTVDKNVDLNAADVSNPRVDGIYLVAYSNADDVSGQNKVTVKVLSGTASAGATLDNRNGAGDPSTAFGSKAYLHIADCLVNANNSPAFSGSNIRDRRRSAFIGSPPIFINGVGTVAEIVQPIPYHGQNVDGMRIGPDYSGSQACALFWVPKTIYGVSAIRWHYHNGSPGIGTGTQYKWALCDPSGRKFAETNATALGASTADAAYNPVDLLTAPVDIPAGFLRVWFGIGTIASGFIYTSGVDMDFNRTSPDNSSTTDFGKPGANPIHNDIQFRKLTGGVTFGLGSDLNTIRYMTDHSNGPSSANEVVPVPLFTLSKE